MDDLPRTPDAPEFAPLRAHDDMVALEDYEHQVAMSRQRRCTTPTTLGLSYSTSPSASATLLSRSDTPRLPLDQQVDFDYMISPPWAPSPGPSARLSSLSDAQSEFPSSATSLRSNQVRL